MKTLDEALDLPFEDYIAWCWDYCRAASERDPMVAYIFDTAGNHGGFACMEALWAKRYWFHKNGGYDK